MAGGALKTAHPTGQPIQSPHVPRTSGRAQDPGAGHQQEEEEMCAHVREGGSAETQLHVHVHNYRNTHAWEPKPNYMHTVG